MTSTEAMPLAPDADVHESENVTVDETGRELGAIAIWTLEGEREVPLPITVSTVLVNAMGPIFSAALLTMDHDAVHESALVMCPWSTNCFDEMKLSLVVDCNCTRGDARDTKVMMIVAFALLVASNTNTVIDT